MKKIKIIGLLTAMLYCSANLIIAVSVQDLINAGNLNQYYQTTNAGVTLNLSSQNLNSLKGLSKLPGNKDITSLILSKNKLSSDKGQDLITQIAPLFPNLRYLSLALNKDIKGINPYLFSLMPFLRRVFATDTGLTEVPDEILQDLKDKKARQFHCSATCSNGRTLTPDYKAKKQLDAALILLELSKSCPAAEPLELGIHSDKLNSTTTKLKKSSNSAFSDWHKTDAFNKRRYQSQNQQIGQQESGAAYEDKRPSKKRRKVEKTPNTIGKNINNCITDGAEANDESEILNLDEENDYDIDDPKGKRRARNQ
ncbi:hypothetical protein K9K77_01530 [Candidatus Babeliales bacterium]|nr:hypothetical protein [Candidatus Babeliales bacterium]